MIEQAEQLPVRRPAVKVGRIPIPHEHGAWVMLYLPAVVGFCVARGAALWQWAALLTALTGLFLAREAAGLLIRRRGRKGTGFWLAVYLAAATAGAAPLLLGPGGPALLTIGGIAALLFGIHSLLLIIPARKRLDRSLWGEVLGAAGLTLSGPAAWAVAHGSLESGAWTVWAFSALYFGGGIIYVKMWLEAAKYRKCWAADTRDQIGRETLLFHTGLTAALLFIALSDGRAAGLLLLAAFAPALVRAFYGWAKLSPVLPNLKVVGLLESISAIWFGAFLIASLLSG